LGDLGLNYVSGSQPISPINLGTETQPSQVVLTGNAICVTFVDGSVRCAGDNTIGQASTSQPIYRNDPPAVAAFNLN
jgi:hypothetical protein